MSDPMRKKYVGLCEECHLPVYHEADIEIYADGTPHPCTLGMQETTPPKRQLSVEPPKTGKIWPKPMIKRG